MKKFNPLNVSSKFAICGLPIRVDSYRSCSFGCRYCFANTREIMNTSDTLQVADVEMLRRYLERVLGRKEVRDNNFLDTLVSKDMTWHWGGMSDPFQPCEKEYHITRDLLEATNQYNIHALFSTKSNTVYDANVNPELHSFQLSISNVDNRHDIEPNIPDIESRIEFFNYLKKNGFRVGIRIQPFIPDISTLDIVKMFSSADHFTIEGIKLVPQATDAKALVFDELGFDRKDFKQLGLLGLRPEIRLQQYKPFIDYFTEHNMSFSISDNDLRYIGNNMCCCGDALVQKTPGIDITCLMRKHGINYSIDDVFKTTKDVGVGNCVCNYLFNSSRQEGLKTVDEYIERRFTRRVSPFSPKYQYIEKTHEESNT